MKTTMWKITKSLQQQCEHKKYKLHKAQLHEAYCESYGKSLKDCSCSQVFMEEFCDRCGFQLRSYPYDAKK